MHIATIEAWIQDNRVQSLSSPTSRKRFRDQTDDYTSDRYNLRKRVCPATQTRITPSSHRRNPQGPSWSKMPPALRQHQKPKTQDSGRLIEGRRPASNESADEEDSRPQKTTSRGKQKAVPIKTRGKQTAMKSGTFAAHIALPTPSLSLAPTQVDGSLYTKSITSHDQQRTSEKARSLSPSKKSSKFGGMQYHANPMTLRSIDNMSNKKARNLLRQLRDVARSKGVLQRVIPKGYSDSMCHVLIVLQKPTGEDTDEDPDVSFFDQAHIYSIDSVLKKTPSMDVIQELCEQSVKCAASSASEAVWNLQVHSQLLKHALRATSLQGSVSYQYM